MESLSQRLVRLRNASELSVAEVARRLNVSPSTYREWEYGRQINGEPYVKLAEVFGIGLIELMTGHKSEIEVYLSQIENSLKLIRKQI